MPNASMPIKLAQPAACCRSKGICLDLSSLRSQAERSTVQHAGAFGSWWDVGDWAGSSRTQNGQPAKNGAAAKLRTQGSHNYMQRRGESKVSKFALICFSIYHLHVGSGIKRESRASYLFLLHAHIFLACTRPTMISGLKIASTYIFAPNASAVRI